MGLSRLNGLNDDELVEELKEISRKSNFLIDIKILAQMKYLIAKDKNQKSDRTHCK